MALRKGMTAGTVIGAMALGAIGWGGYSAQSKLSLLREADAAMALQPAGPVSNLSAKGDRLQVASYQLASLPSAGTPIVSPFAPLDAPPAPSAKSEPQTTAVAPVAPARTVEPRSAEPRPAETRQVEKPKPQPQPPKPSGLLDDAQIAAIKGRLRLTSDQEGYWPAVEAALKDVVKTQLRKKDGSRPSTIDTNSPEVQRLTWAAMPLLFRMREDQKREVRTLARLMGLDSVAAQI